nr:reverse transcriptase domain-containing protein [Tanacetum cinerariifolium]
MVKDAAKVVGVSSVVKELVLSSLGVLLWLRRLKLSQQLSKVHSTFHVSNMKKCLSDESLIISLEEIQIDDKLHLIEESIEIMDTKVKRLNHERFQSSSYDGIQEEVLNSPGSVKTSFERNIRICFLTPHYHRIPLIELREKTLLTGKDCDN